MRDENSKGIEMPNPTTQLCLDRRDFIKLLGGGIVVLFTLDVSSFLAGQESRGRGYPTDINAYLRIGEDGRVTVYSGKIEMGQGVMTSLAQMAADELGVALESIDMVMGDTELCPYDMGTYGSMSTRFFGPALRGAAAEAKAVLLELASERLKTPKEKLSTENGVAFVTSDKKTRVTFGQLAKGQRITRKLDAKAVTKSVSEFSLMGKPVNRLDALLKVTGQAQYAGDVRLPDIFYAKILRPPAHGARLQNVDTSGAEKIPGVTVVKEDGRIAVLHRDPEVAEKALASIRAEFDVPKPTVDDKTIFDHLLNLAPQAQERERKGDLAVGEKTSAALFERKYVNGYGAHAPIETQRLWQESKAERQRSGHRLNRRSPTSNRSHRPWVTRPKTSGSSLHSLAAALAERTAAFRPSKRRSWRRSRENPCKSLGTGRKNSSTTRSGPQQSSRSSRVWMVRAGSAYGTTMSILPDREAPSNSTMFRTISSGFTVNGAGIRQKRICSAPALGALREPI